MPVSLGIDYGTNSVRALLVGVANGRELAGPAKGGHADVQAAEAAMNQPRPEHQAVYNQLYGLYRQLHDASGGLTRCADLSRVMKDLIDSKEAPTALESQGV